MNSELNRSGERQRPEVTRQRPVKGNLPRLTREYYRGHAFVHWTLTIEDRATGWLSSEFH